MKQPALLVLGSLLLLSALACLVVQWNGWTLYYGDAEAHLEVARRIIDSRTAGYNQVGAVWLPLPHALMLPLVGSDRLWRTGLAGAIPAAACWVAAGMLLFAAARRAFRSTAAAVASTGIFALNPNLLYLQATPMTEAVFFAGLLALLYFTVLFHDTKSTAAAAGAGLATFAATLTRYEGWFLIPFVTAYLFLTGGKRRTKAALIYGALAALGPVLWIAHNVWWFGDPLDFYRGPYSAKAIYERALDKGLGRYPGDHDWRTALHYFASAARQTVGPVAVILGAGGAVVAALRRVLWPLCFLALPPVFYVASMYSSGTPIFVPNLFPHGYYNTRYGLAVLPWAAFAGGALVFLLPVKVRPTAAAAILLAACGWWALRPSPENWLCWKESQMNSDARRAWTAQAASYLSAHYDGGGIFTMLGDVAGIYREAAIPLRATLNDGNEPQWMACAARPDVFLHERWAVAQAGDAVSSAMARTGIHGAPYRLVDNIKVDGAPAIEIYRRCIDEHSIH